LSTLAASVCGAAIVLSEYLELPRAADSVRCKGCDCRWARSGCYLASRTAVLAACRCSCCWPSPRAVTDAADDKATAESCGATALLFHDPAAPVVVRILLARSVRPFLRCCGRWWLHTHDFEARM